MNVLITLPKHLIDEIISGNKKYEMRLAKPIQMKLGEDGFFCVEKGTKWIRCWCKVDTILELNTQGFDYDRWAKDLAVSPQFIKGYVGWRKKAYLWHIDKVIVFEDESLCRDSLYVDRNPQQFAYCPLSYGESY